MAKPFRWRKPQSEWSAGLKTMLADARVLEQHALLAGVARRATIKSRNAWLSVV